MIDFVLPPGGLFVLAMIGALLLRRRPAAGRAIIIVAMALLYGLSTPLVATLLVHPLQLSRAPTLGPPGLIKPTAIVVLGAGQGHVTDEKSGPGVDLLSLVRLRGAAEVWRETGLPILVSGGQISTEGPPLAAQMRHSLVEDFRVPVRWVEAQSLNTAENAIFSAKLLRAAGVETVYLVTQAWHMPRAVQAFSGVGMTVVPAPQAAYSDHEVTSPSAFIPNARALSMSAYALHEWVGLIWYRLRYGFAFPALEEARP